MWWLLLLPWAGLCLLALALARSASLADERLEADAAKRASTKSAPRP
jgi:hypothetical protein